MCASGCKGLTGPFSAECLCGCRGGEATTYLGDVGGSEPWWLEFRLATYTDVGLNQKSHGSGTAFQYLPFLKICNMVRLYASQCLNHYCFPFPLEVSEHSRYQRSGKS